MFGLIQYLPLIFVLVVVVSIVRNVLRLTKKLGDTSSSLPRAPEAYDPGLSERTRRVQDEIRRKIAERRGLARPPVAESVQPYETPPVMVQESPVQPALTTEAVLERQQQLADQMRALELARLGQQRRAAAVVSLREAMGKTEAGQLVGSRGELLADLRAPGSLRRAIVLREVLGSPVGLR